MSLVVDASVVVSALAGSPRRGAPAREAMRRSGGMHAPHVLDVEVPEALRGLALAGKLQADPAAAALRRYALLRVRRHSQRTLLPRVWELRHNLTAHDAIYVALAEALATPLLTEDAGIAGAVGVRCRVQLLGGEIGC